MSCRPNPAPDSTKVWLLSLPIDLSLHIFGFIHGLFICFKRGFLSIFFPSIYRLSTTPQFSLLYTTSLLAFCFVFPIPLCSPPTPTLKCLRAIPLPTKSKFFNGTCLKHIVAPEPLGKAHYLPLLLVTSFLRNYYGGPCNEDMKPFSRTRCY